MQSRGKSILTLSFWHNTGSRQTYGQTDDTLRQQIASRVANNQVLVHLKIDTACVNKLWCWILLTSVESINKNVQFRLATGTSEQASNSSEVKYFAHQLSIVLRCVDDLNVKFTDAVDSKMMRADSGNVDVKIWTRMVLSQRLRQSKDLLRNGSWCRSWTTGTI